MFYFIMYQVLKAKGICPFRASFIPTAHSATDRDAQATTSSQPLKADVVQ
jgi:hypothetical protein